MNLRVLADEFYTSKAAAGRSHETVVAYMRHIGNFIDWATERGFIDSDLVGSVGAETIEEYMVWQRNTGYAESTIRSGFRHVRALYRWIERRHGVMEEGNPFDMLTEPKAPKLLPKAISAAQVHVLLHSIKGDRWIQHRDRLIIKTLFETGLRQGELVALTTNDVDLERRRLRVMRWKVKREDLVPISKSLREEFEAWLTTQRPECDHDSLWPAYLIGGKGSVGGPLTAAGLKQLLRYRCKRAGMKNYFPHSFRHGCAVRIIQAGGDITLVQKVLGHADIRSSEQYLRFDTDGVQALYDRIFT